MPVERGVRALSCAALAVLWAAPAPAQQRGPTRELIDAVGRRCPATHPSSRHEGKGVFAGGSVWGRGGEWHVTCTFTANEYHFASGWKGFGLRAGYVDEVTDDWPAQVELAGCNAGGGVHEIDAMRNLARLYENGRGVPADPDQAHYRWDRAGGR